MSKQPRTVVTDEEKVMGGPATVDEEVEMADVQDVSSNRLIAKLMSLQSVEARGIQPVPADERTHRHTYSLFTLWFSMSTNPLPVVTGMTGTLSYGLSLEASALTILFFAMLCTVPAAYLATLGPKTGMRQMVQARFSFGYWLACVPVLFNLATLTGFCVIDAVIGGQTLSAVSNGKLSGSVGIVIVAILSMLVCFCGFKILHQYERFAWVPALIALIVATGTGGKHLHQQVDAGPQEASTIMSFAALLAGFFVAWAPLASDFATYMRPDTKSWKIFAYTYCGLLVPSIPLLILGAAIGGAVPNVPSWTEGNDRDSAGGVLAAMLQPAGVFGKFLVVLLALSMLANLSGTMYSVSLNFQILLPWLVRVPRALFAIVVTAIVIPVAIRASTSFFDSLENFIGIIGYWASSFVAVVIVEHCYFRKSDFLSYRQSDWNVAKALPSGVAALGAAACSFALIIPSMAQIWYTGPIALHTGDIGFELAFVVTALLYVPFRHLEIKLQGRL